MLRKMFSTSICRLILLGICILTVNCDGGLSRSEAGRQISADQKFAEPMKVEFRYGKVYGKGVGESTSLDMSLNMHIYTVLESLGYIETGYDPNPLMDIINLTEKGKRESAKWEQGSGMLGNHYKIPVLKREVVEVTGISEPKAGENKAEATFKWRWQPLNDIGETLLKNDKNTEQIFQGSANLQKFDDGWRLVKVSGNGISGW